MSPEDKEKLERIRLRHSDRMAGGQVGGVLEWFEIATLLRLLDEQICKNCKDTLEP